MKETATDHYKSRQSNCAQSVALAWKEKRQPESDHYDRLSGCGRGQAPEGTCGALYAACEIAGDTLKDIVKEKFTRQTTGHTTCKGIRSNRIMPCAQCVATAAGILDELIKENAL